MLYRSHPYAAVLRDKRVRRVLPGFAVSFLGDGMSAIAVTWLALTLAPPDRAGLWVAAAVTAYTLPSVLGTFVLAKPLRGRGGAQLVAWDAWLRAASLGAVAIAGAVGVLGLGLLVGLLAVSSLLHSWGSAGQYTLLAELLPEREHVPANALLSVLSQTGVLLGPPIAGLVIGWHGAAWVLAVDAATFVVLALTCGSTLPPAPSPAASTTLAARTSGTTDTGRTTDTRSTGSAADACAAGPGYAAGPGGTGSAAKTGSAAGAGRAGEAGAGAGGAGAGKAAGGGPSRGAGFRVIAADRRLFWLLALTFVFYVLYGPVEVGLPVYVSDYQHAPATQLAWYFTAFGAGSVAGGMAAGYLRDWPLRPTVAGIVIGVGVALLPLGLGAPTAVAVGALALAGFVHGPYGSITTALFQRAAAPGARTQVLAARRTVMIISGPVGVGLGGILVTTSGVRPAMLITALGTIALGLLTALALILPTRRGEPVTRAGDEPVTRAGDRPVIAAGGGPVSGVRGGPVTRVGDGPRHPGRG